MALRRTWESLGRLRRSRSCTTVQRPTAGCEVRGNARESYRRTVPLPPLPKLPPLHSLAQMPPLPSSQPLPFLVDHGTACRTPSVGSSSSALATLRPSSSCTSTGFRDPTQSMYNRSSQAEEYPLMTITVVSAMTGNVMASVTLPSSSTIAGLKLEVEKATGLSAFCLNFLHEGGDCVECCRQDFASLETALGGTDSVRLQLVASQVQQDIPMALPFDARERDYLPRGESDSALGMARSWHPPAWRSEICCR